MKISCNFKRGVVLLLVFQLLIAPLSAQTQSQGEVGQSGIPATQTSSHANELDALLGAGTYAFYFEMRFAELAAQAQSNAHLFAAFAPLFRQQKFEIPPSLIEFSRKYEAELQQGNLVFAALASRPEIPQLLAAIQLSSPEVATRFEADAKILIAALRTELLNTGRKSSGKSGRQTRQQEELLSKFNITTQRRASLVILSERPFDLTQLRPAGSPAFIDDERVRSARERFAQDGLVYFVDVAGLIDSTPQLIKSLDALSALSTATPNAGGAKDETASSRASLSNLIPPETLDRILNLLRNNLPSAMAAGAKFEGDNYVGGSLVMPRQGQDLSLTPIIPIPVMGPALNMKVPHILPSDVTMAGSVSLDFLKSYDKALELFETFTKLWGAPATAASSNGQTAAAQIAKVEELLGFNVKDELLASLGHEAGFALQIKSYPWEKTSVQGTKPNPALKTEDYSLALLLEVADRGRLEALMPRILDALKLVAADANVAPKIEQMGSTAITSYGNFSYAFINNFLVVADQPETLRRIIDAGIKGEVLASNVDFRAALGDGAALTRFYVSKDVMASLDASFQKSLAVSKPKSGAVDRVALKDVLASFNREPRPMTYLVTPDPAGAYHEMRIPTGLYTLFVAYALSEASQAKSVSTTPRRKKTIRRSGVRTKRSK